jgi:hypothetical protein
VLAGAGQTTLPSPSSSERGQASAELVAIVPLLVVLVLATGQALVAGYALWSAGVAARAGARAEHVGGDPRAAARSALPSPLRSGARIKTGGPVEVTVGAPALLPGAPALKLRATSKLDPTGGDA